MRGPSANVAKARAGPGVCRSRLPPAGEGCIGRNVLGITPRGSRFWTCSPAGCDKSQGSASSLPHLDLICRVDVRISFSGSFVRIKQNKELVVQSSHIHEMNERRCLPWLHTLWASWTCHVSGTVLSFMPPARPCEWVPFLLPDHRENQAPAWVVQWRGSWF